MRTHLFLLPVLLLLAMAPKPEPMKLAALKMDAIEPASQPASRPAAPVSVRQLIERMPTELKPASNDFWTDEEAKLGIAWVKDQLAGTLLRVDAETWSSSSQRATAKVSFDLYGRKWNITANCVLTEPAERVVRANKKTKRLRFAGRATSGSVMWSGNPILLHIQLANVSVTKI